LHELSLEDYKGLSDKFAEDVHGVFDFEASVEKRRAIGGPALQMIDRQVKTLQAILEE
jgi:argininosuccinate lyase